jgi:hypothetical protein
MVFRLVKLAAVVAVIVVIAASVPDIKRYIELRNM